LFVKLITWLASLTLGAAVALVSMQVILRFGFNMPQAWAEEVGRYLFVWAVYLGAIIALANNTHIRVTILTELLGPRMEAFSQRLNWIVSVLAFAFITYFGFQLAYTNRATRFYTLPDMPRVLFFLAVPVCFAIMTIYLLWPKRRTRPEPASEPAEKPKLL
jgi:TRAP-type C4-dicarboxylate transport system permease small subunit